MKITYNKEIPSVRNKHVELLDAIKSFLNSDKTTMCVEFNDTKEARSRYEMLYGKRRRSKSKDYDVYLRGNRVFILKS